MAANILLQICQVLTVLNFIYTYVLFAANLDDFRSIAKKFIPAKLAEQLTDMASQNAMKYRQQLGQNKQGKEQYSGHNDEDIEYIDKPATVEFVTRGIEVKRGQPSKKKRFSIKDTVETVDFEELVDRVRQKLGREFPKPKSELNINRNKDRTDAYSDFYKDTSHNIHRTDRTTKDTSHNIHRTDTTPKLNTKTTEDAQYEENEPAPEDNGFFKEADLTKIKDSYEDYVTPKRDEMFESEETNHQGSAEKTQYMDQRLKAVVAETENNKEIVEAEYEPQVEAVPLAEAVTPAEDDQEYEDEVNIPTEEVKAKTENLLEPDPKSKPKKLKGTMIPTREYFKMSSPNYYGKLPAVAEKYDFNEPLPEQDREPENLKHFVNPPSSINKKVKLTMMKSSME